MSDLDSYFKYSNRMFIIYMLTGIVLRMSVVDSDSDSLIGDCLYYLICKMSLDGIINGLYKLDQWAEKLQDTR